MKRILFVDDEPRILEGLQRLLRSQRSRWEMAFAPGGEAALAMLAAEPFDVVVSDMRMPGMDGAALLACVKERFPQAVRIVLSGHTDVGTTLKTVSVAHQFLTKPCDPDELQEVIDHVCRLRALLDNEAIRQIVGQMGELPSSPRLYAALTRALKDPEVPLAQVAKVVEQDVAMSVKCLQLVNSAFFGLPRRLTSIGEAVNYLGVATLRTLVLSAEIFRAFETRDVEGFSIAALEAHAFMAANLALRLPAEGELGQQAFMAAMLHEVGTLVLAARLPGQLALIGRVTSERGCARREVEQELLGTTHAKIGAYLLGLWGLPWPIVEAVACHGAPMLAGGRTFDLVGAVHVAGVLASEALGNAEGAVQLGCGGLDLEYLRTVGAIESLDRWRASAGDLIISRGAA